MECRAEGRRRREEGRRDPTQCFWDEIRCTRQNEYVREEPYMGTQAAETNTRKAVKAGAVAPKTLGEKGEDTDVDMLSWVEKNRTRLASSAGGHGEMGGTRGDTRGTRGATGDEKEARHRDDRPGRRRKDDVGPPVPQEQDDLLSLGRAKVKGHSLDALEVNDEMILTLADRGILDAAGNDVAEEDDVMLENVRERELVAREKANLAAQKAKPLWEEDGVKRSMLDKYDEEEEEAFVLGDGGRGGAGGAGGSGRTGGLSQHPVTYTAGDASVKSKLEAAKMSILAPLKAIGGDYYTAEEMEKKDGKAKKKPREGKAKRTRKLKKKALTEDEIADLEMAAKERGDAHLATKEERKERLERKGREDEEGVAAKRLKFDAALERANVKSKGLRSDIPGVDDRDGGDDEEEDDELAASLAKARAVALGKKGNPAPEDVAKMAIARREKLEREIKEEEEKDVLTFTNIGEFARSIKGEEAQDEDDYMDLDIDIVVKKEPSARTGRKYRKHQETEHGTSYPGTLEEGERVEGGEEEVAPTHNEQLGRGLGSVLSLLKDRGELNKPVEWGGRINDSRNSFFTNAMGGYKDVYTGGRTDDEIAANVEVALTRKDEFGRVMTPKEAFRQFCHKFHGIQPRQNSKEKRLKQVQRELSQKRRDASAGSSNISKLQKNSKTPFLSLDGTVVKPGQQR